MREQTVGWALHALEPDEEMAALEHLETCDACRQLAAEVAEVTSGLAEAVEQREPPARLRASIVEQAERTEQVRQVPSRPEPAVEERGAPMRAAAPSRPRHRATTGPDTPRPADRPTSRFRRPRSLLAIVAAVVVLAGGGGLAAYAQQMRAERDASIAQSRDIFQMVAQFDQPGAQHAFLAASPGAQPVAAVMVHGDQRQVMAVGLTPNGVADQTYVLWGLNEGAQPKPVGTFDVQPTPERPVSVGSATGGSFSQYAVSLERGRVAPASPSSVIASGQVET
jgi:hypothetical protein